MKDLLENVKGLLNGTLKFQIINSPALISGDVMLVEAMSVAASEIFSESKTGKDKQLHSSNFESLLKSVGTKIETSEIKVQKHILQKKLSDFQIRDLLGGQDKVTHTTKAAALATLSKTMTDEYRDGKANIVYYLNDKGELCYAHCRWNSVIEEWFHDCFEASGNAWGVGYRVFCPVAES